MAAIRQVYLPKSSAEIRDQLLQDMRLAAIDTGVDEPPVEPGTDWYILNTGISKQCMMGTANIALSAQDASVLDATGAALDKHRVALGLPEVEPTGSSGKIIVEILGTTTIPSNTEIKLPNGLRIKTVGASINPSDGDEIDVTAIDKGALTNFPGGTEVTFVSAPTNVSATARVSYEFPLTGGTDAETDERKRSRIINTLKNKPAGGNWAYLRQLVLNEHGFVQDVYVYPAPGGPSSQLIVPVRAFDIANNDYSRAPSSALLQAIRNTLQADANVGIETVVRAATEENADFALLLDIPDSVLAGGNGQGWTDPTPWPQLSGGETKVTVTNYDPATDVLTINAATSTSPIEGQTQIAWWSPADRKFYTALVTDVDGASTAGSWIVTLDRPLVGNDGVGPSTGDYISPNAQNLSAYGDTWVALFNELGTGEITTDADLLPRGARKPSAADEDPYSVTNAFLAKVTRKHPEISDVEFSYSPTTSPTVPSSVDSPPAVLIPRHFAVYPTS